MFCQQRAITNVIIALCNCLNCCTQQHFISLGAVAAATNGIIDGSSLSLSLMQGTRDKCSVIAACQVTTANDKNRHLNAPLISGILAVLVQSNKNLQYSKNVLYECKNNFLLHIKTSKYSVTK